MGFARGLQEGEGRNSDTEPQQGRSRKGEDVTGSQGRVKARRATTTLWEGRTGGRAARPWRGMRQSTELTEFFGRTVVPGPGPSQQRECGCTGWQGRTEGSPGISPASLGHREQQQGVSTALTLTKGLQQRDGDPAG